MNGWHGRYGLIPNGVQQAQYYFLNSLDGPSRGRVVFLRFEVPTEDVSSFLAETCFLDRKQLAGDRFPFSMNRWVQEGAPSWWTPIENDAVTSGSCEAQEATFGNSLYDAGEVMVIYLQIDDREREGAATLAIATNSATATSNGLVLPALSLDTFVLVSVLGGGAKSLARRALKLTYRTSERQSDCRDRP